MPPPVYRIETPRLVLRCWTPADEPLLRHAITASLDHLRPWMPWANGEPILPEERVKLLRRFRSQFDADRDFVYGILDPDESEVLGGTGLHPRVGPGALEIGYWIRADRTGEGLATEAAAALTRVAFSVHRAARLEIRCDPRNVASAAIPRKLGYTHEGTLRDQAVDAEGRRRATMVWSFLHDEHGSDALRSLRVAAYDACGNRILPAASTMNAAPA